MGDTSQPAGLDRKPTVAFEFQPESRRQIQSLPRDFREHDDKATDLLVSAKFYSVPRQLPTDSESEAPKRKGGLPRLLDFLARKNSKELKYHKQENDSTEGSAERDSVHEERDAELTSPRPTSILLRPWLATEEEAASLTGLSKSPLLSSPEVMESASLSPSLMNILQIINKSSIYLSNTEPTWIREENIHVIAHIEYRSSAAEHLSFKVGQRIFQTQGADDNGLAFGTMRKYRFSKQKTGYYPANYVIPKPVRKPCQMFRLWRRNVSRLPLPMEEPEENELSDADASEAEFDRKSSLPVIRKSSKACRCSVYPIVDNIGTTTYD